MWALSGTLVSLYVCTAMQTPMCNRHIWARFQFHPFSEYLNPFQVRELLQSGLSLVFSWCSIRAVQWASIDLCKDWPAPYVLIIFCNGDEETNKKQLSQDSFNWLCSVARLADAQLPSKTSEQMAQVAQHEWPAQKHVFALLPASLIVKLASVSWLILPFSKRESLQYPKTAGETALDLCFSVICLSCFWYFLSDLTRCDSFDSSSG